MHLGGGVKILSPDNLSSPPEIEPKGVKAGAGLAPGPPRSPRERTGLAPGRFYGHAPERDEMLVDRTSLERHVKRLFESHDNKLDLVLAALERQQSQAKSDPSS